MRPARGPDGGFIVHRLSTEDDLRGFLVDAVILVEQEEDGGGLRACMGDRFHLAWIQLSRVSHLSPDEPYGVSLVN